MTKISEQKLLALVGNVLYGERWQTDLARDLRLSDGRRIRQWLSLDRTIPDGVWDDLAKLLADRKLVIDEALNAIQSNLTTQD